MITPTKHAQPIISQANHHRNTNFFKLMAITFLSSCLLMLNLPASANEHSIGDVTIHYNAFSSTQLPAEVTSKYQLTRSGRVGVINITVMKNEKPVIANIFGHGKNLAGQLRELAFREIREEQAVYYIATFNFTNGEKLRFDLNIQVEKTGVLVPLQFKQQMFSN